MNKINYILTTLLLGGAVVLNAQTPATVSDMQLADTLSVGYRINVSSQTSSYSVNGVNASAFEKSPHIDISKALYGKVAGLNVYQRISRRRLVSRQRFFSLHTRSCSVSVDRRFSSRHHRY